jgi:hypothetical protein
MQHIHCKLDIVFLKGFDYLSFIDKLSTYTLDYYSLVPITILITLLTNYPYKNNIIFNTPPQDDAYIFIMLILSITLEKSVILNLFVKTSAICSLVPTKGIHTIPSSSLSLMKCRSISTCLVLSCCTRLFAMFIAALLSQYNMMGLSSNNPNSSSNLRSYNSSLTPWAMALYSASAVDLATTFCFLLLQETILPHTNAQ